MTAVDDAPSRTDRAAAFRAELRAWLEANLTPEIVAHGAPGLEGENLDELREWNRTLADAGWAAPAWPSQFGGRDATLDEQLAYAEEMSRYDAPGPINVIGVANIAPAIMVVGTEEQKQRFIRPMLRGDEIWSQGMSEPDAGSDLASLRTRAELDGDHFVINGQKIWNSLGHHADWCQLYVRTDPDAPKHKGISCLLVDLHSPGVEARPLKTMAGDTPFAELFFEDVRVPRSALLGPLNEGWRVAMTTLSFERAGVANFHLGIAKQLDRLVADLKARGPITDPRTRDALARLHSKVAAMRYMVYRSLETVRQGGTPSLGFGSMVKLLYGSLSQELAALAVDLMGMDGLSEPWGKRLAGAQSSTIAGGTNEINRNIVAEQALGLPREPR